MECARLTRYGLLSVTGEDARAFLHAQLTKDIENLPPDRATLAGCRVTIDEHLDRTWSIGYGPHIVGRYNREGIPLQLEPSRPNTTNQPLTPKQNRTLHVL